MKLHRRRRKEMRLVSGRVDGWVVTRASSKQSIVAITSNHRSIAGLSSPLNDWQSYWPHIDDHPRRNWTAGCQGLESAGLGVAWTTTTTMIVRRALIISVCCPALQSCRIRAAMTFDPSSTPLCALALASSLSSADVFFSAAKTHWPLSTFSVENRPIYYFVAAAAVITEHD